MWFFVVLYGSDLCGSVRFVCGSILCKSDLCGSVGFVLSGMFYNNLMYMVLCGSE